MQTSDPNPKSGHSTGDPPRLAVWSDARGSELLAGVLRHLEVTPVGIGAAEEQVRRALSAGGEATVFDDPRTGPRDCGAHALLSADNRLDPEAFRRSECTLLSLEPLAVPEDVAQSVLRIGALEDSAGFRAAQQVLESFGPVASVQVVCHSAAGQGSLHARLDDALRVLERLVGSLEMVDAMHVGPQAAQSSEPVHAHIEAIPETVSGLTGDLGVLVRHEPRAFGLVSVSDQCGWQRVVRLHGEGGTLEFDELGVSWTDATGAVIESREPVADPFDEACRQIAERVRCFDQPGALLPRSEPAGPTLAACEAVRLSCRTRAPESVSKISELLART